MFFLGSRSIGFPFFPKPIGVPGVDIQCRQGPESVRPVVGDRPRWVFTTSGLHLWN